MTSDENADGPNPEPVPEALARAIDAARGAPDDEAAWDAVDEAARDEDRPDEVASLYRAILGSDLPKARLLELGQRAVAFHDEWYEDPQRVIEVLRHILKIDVNTDWAFERLSLVLTMAERWDTLLDEYDRALESEPTLETQVKLLDEGARIAKDFAGQGDRANSYLKRLLLLKPDDDQLASSLERRLEQSDGHADLVEIWQARLAVLSGADALATRVQIADRFLERLNDAGAALAEVEKLLACDGGEAEACALLERIAARSEAPSPTRRRALTVLESRYADAGKAEEVVRILELSLPLAETTEEKVELHRRAARWLSELGRTDGAIEHCALLLVLSPGAEDMHAQLRELVERSSAHARYADALVSAADACEHPARAIALLVEAGEVAAETLADEARATQLFTRVLNDDAADAAAHLTVAQRLTRLLVSDDQMEERLGVLERLASLEPEESARRGVLGEAASLAERLGDDDRALGLWQRRLEMTPSDVPALDARVAILERTERWDALIADLRRRAAQVEADDDKRTDLVRVATTYETRLGATEKAIQVWREIQDTFGANDETVDALAELSARAKRWTDVVELLRGAVDGEEEADRRTQQLTTLGDVFREQRQDAARAVEYYGDALSVDPRAARARAGLEALLSTRDAAPSAVETLAAAFKSSDEWEGTLDLMETRIEAAQTPEQRVSILLEAADLREARAQDPAAALDLMTRAFALTPTTEVEAEIGRLAEQTSDWRAAARGYAAAIESTSDDERVAQLRFRLGSIFEDQLGELENALESYQRLAQSDRSRVAAASAVVRVAARIGRWPALAEAWVESQRALGASAPDLDEAVTEAAAASAGWDTVTVACTEAVASAEDLDARTAHDLKRQLGVWQRDHRRDLDAAEAMLKSAVGHHQAADTLSMLAELQRRSPGRALVETLLALADATEAGLAPLYEASDVALNAVGDPELAEPILTRTLELGRAEFTKLAKSDPDGARGSLPEQVTAWTVDRLAEHRLAQGRADEALALLTKAADLPFAETHSVSLRYRAAEVAAGKLDRADRAIELCTGILDRVPGHATTITLLGELYEAAGDLKQLLELRRRELGLEPPLDRRLELRVDVARVLGALDRPAKDRINALEENLAEQPGHARSVDDLALLLESEGQHAELCDLFTAQAEEVTESGSPLAAAELWARAGGVAEQQLDQLDRALGAYKNSVALGPTTAVLDALAGIHSGRDDHRAAVEWLEQRVQLTERTPETVEERRDAVTRLARALRAAKNVARAKAVLVDELGHDSTGEAMRDLLAELYRESREWAPLSQLLEQGAASTEDKERKIAWLRDAADVQRHKLGSLDAAIPLLQAAVELNPDDRPLRLNLSDALRHSERYDEARAILTSLLEEFGRRRTPVRATVHYHLAKIARSCGDLDEALSQLEAASGIERSDPYILKLLGDVAREKGELEAAERAYRALLLILGRQKAPQPDNEEPIGESSILFELHRIATDMGQGERAQELLVSALDSAAQNPEESQKLEHALREAGQTELLLRALGQRLEHAESPEDAADALVARADVFEGMERNDEALATRLEAITKVPGDEALIDATATLAENLGRHAEFTEQLLALADRSAEDHPDIACSLWLRLGTVAERAPDGLGRAAVLFDKAQATGEQPLATYQALERVHASLDDADGRARGLSRFVEVDESLTDTAAHIDALYSLAELELANVDTQEAGAARLERALDRDHQGDRATGMLIRAVESDARGDTVVRLFERVARESGDQALLLTALLHSSMLPDATLDLLRDAVYLARDLDRPEALEPLLDRTVAIARGTEELADVLWAVEDLANIKLAAGDAATAAKLLGEAVDAAAIGQAFDYRLKLGDVALNRLGDLKLAATCFEKLREVDATDVRVWKPLLAVYRGLGDMARLEQCIEETEELLVDDAERTLLRLERVRILLVDSARHDEAEAALREILDGDPDHREAGDLLVDLLEKQGRHAELQEALQAQLDAAKNADDADGVSALALRLGTTLAASDPRAALEMFLSCLTWVSGNRDVLVATLALFTDEDPPEDRAQVMEHQLALETGEAAEPLALELSELRRSLDDELGAERALELGFRAHPSGATIKGQLFSLYEQREQWAKLAELLEYDGEQREDAAERLAQLRRAASVYEEHLGDPAAAARALLRAAEVAGADIEVLSDLTRNLVAAGRAEEGLDVVGRAIDSGDASEDALPRLLHLRAAVRAKLSEDDLSGITTAVADLDRAVSLGGRNVVADLAAVVERQRFLAEGDAADDVERVATLRLAELLPQIREPQRAVEILVGWVRRHPSDAGAVRALGDLAASGKKWGAASKAYARLVDITEGDERVAAVTLLAETCEASGDPMAARESLEAVFRDMPTNIALRDRLRQMYEAAGAFYELGTMLLAEARETTDPEAQFELLCSAGDLFLRTEEGGETAFTAFQGALALKPGNHPITLKLCDAHIASGQLQEAANLLDGAIREFGKKRSPELAELQYAMARVAQAADDEDALFAWLDAAMQSDRHNGTVASELAVLAMSRGELDTAVKALQLVTLMKTPVKMSKAEAYLRQGMIAQERGDTKKAQLLGKRALTADPDYEDAKAFVARF